MASTSYSVHRERESDEDEEREMDDAEKMRRLHEMYNERFADLTSADQELVSTPIDDSRAVVNRDNLNLVGFDLCKQAFLIVVLHHHGDLSFKKLEGCMRDIFNLLRGLCWTVHRSLSNAGSTLTDIIRGSMQTFMDCVLELLQCAIGYGPYSSPSDANRIPDLARDVLDVYGTISKMPRTNFRAIGFALVRVASGIKEAISEMEKKAGSERGAITELVIRTASDAYRLITELIRAVTEWEKTGAAVTIDELEGLLAMSGGTSSLIDNIKERLFPLRDVPGILQSLNSMDAFIRYVERKVQRCGYRSPAEFDEKATSLKNSIQELKTVLTNH